jgi:hypothetical protein
LQDQVEEFGVLFEPAGLCREKNVSEGQESENSTQVAAELIVLARQAIEQERFKQCAALIKDILKVDPHHEEALKLQSRIDTHLKQHLAKARLYLSASGETYTEFLIRKARSARQRRLYFRVRNKLQAVLDVDPEHQDAKNLLSLVNSLQKVSYPTENELRGRGLPHWTLTVMGVFILLGASGTVWFSMSGSGATKETPAFSKADDVQKAQALVTPVAARIETGSLALFVVPRQSVQMSLDNGPAEAVPESVELKPGAHQLYFTADGYEPKVVSETVVAGERRNLVVLLNSVPPEPAPVVKTARAVPVRQPVVSVPREESISSLSAPLETEQRGKAAAKAGTLALNAQVPVELYLNEKYLGSTPLSIQLPAGMHTLEARYQDLRKMISYTVRSNETTRGTISFEVTVQINANPWAEVSIEGNPPKSLGETPLSGVSLTVGSVLVFKNPVFPEKRYRITGKEATIRIVFP